MHVSTRASTERARSRCLSSLRSRSMPPYAAMVVLAPRLGNMEHSGYQMTASGWRIRRPHPRHLKIGPRAGWGQPPPCRSSRCKPVKLSGMSRSVPQRGQTGSTAWGGCYGSVVDVGTVRGRRTPPTVITVVAGAVRHRPHSLPSKVPIFNQVPDVGKSDEKLRAITSPRPQAPHSYSVWA